MHAERPSELIRELPTSGIKAIVNSGGLALVGVAVGPVESESMALLYQRHCCIGSAAVGNNYHRQW